VLRRAPGSLSRVEVSLPTPRRVPFAELRRGRTCGAPKSAARRAPRALCLPQEVGRPNRTRDLVPCLRGGRFPCRGRGGWPGAPKSSWFPAPARPCAAIPRRVSSAVPRWNLTCDSPRGAVRPVPMAGPCPSRAGDGCARKRCRYDDAPIRRSGPPRHRAHGAPGGRSSRRHPVKSPDDAGAEAPTPRWAIKPPRGLAQPPTVAPEPCRPPEGGRLGSAAEATVSPSRCACTHRSGPTSRPVETSRSSRLQGFAPLTSPS
jgi:hypothetical protein